MIVNKQIQYAAKDFSKKKTGWSDTNINLKLIQSNK